MKAFSNSDKLKSFIAPKMIDLVTFLYNNGKSAVYTWGGIHGLYCYIEMILDPTILITSGRRSHNFGPSCYINNDTATLQPVILDIRMRQNSICEFHVRIRHKADY